MCDKIEELEKKIADLERTNDLLRTLVKKKDARIQELREDYDELNDISIELTQDVNELEKKKEELEVTIHGYIQENLDLYKAKEKLEDENEKLKKANDILTEECNKALMLNDKHGGEAKDLKKENELLRYYVNDWKDREESARNLFARSCDNVTKLEKENEDLKKQLDNALDLYDERGEVIEKHEELKASLKTILNFIYGVDTDVDKIEKLERENELLRQTNIELVNRFGGDTDCIIRSIMVNGGKI